MNILHIWISTIDTDLSLKSQQSLTCTFRCVWMIKPQFANYVTLRFRLWPWYRFSLSQYLQTETRGESNQDLDIVITGTEIAERVDIRLTSNWIITRKFMLAEVIFNWIDHFFDFLLSIDHNLKSVRLILDMEKFERPTQLISQRKRYFGTPNQKKKMSKM